MAPQAYNPGVFWFIEFYTLDPSRKDRCIFYTQKHERCPWPCSNRYQAIRLRETIIAASGAAISLNLLEDYTLSNCCTSANAQHRHRIEDVDLLRPLALRWRDEIRIHTTDQFNHAASFPVLTNPAAAIPRHTTAAYPLTGTHPPSSQ